MQQSRQVSESHRSKKKNSANIRFCYARREIMSWQMLCKKSKPNFIREASISVGENEMIMNKSLDEEVPKGLIVMSRSRGTK